MAETLRAAAREVGEAEGSSVVSVVIAVHAGQICSKPASSRAFWARHSDRADAVGEHVAPKLKCTCHHCSSKRARMKTLSKRRRLFSHSTSLPSTQARCTR